MMAKKTNPTVQSAVPSAVVTPPVEVQAGVPDTTYGTYPTDVTDTTPPSVELQVMAKIMAGLTRPQALEVLDQQRAHDKTLKL